MREGKAGETGMAEANKYVAFQLKKINNNFSQLFYF